MLRLFHGGNMLKSKRKRYCDVAGKDLVKDLKRVAKKLGIVTVSVKIYKSHGFYSDKKLLSLFGTWNKALEAAGLVQYGPSRSVHASMRLKILTRDCFRCVMCKATPADNKSIVLHVDHIIPYSKGGGTIEENLQTLCSRCNMDKRASLPLSQPT